eukprot:SAG11_NODE_42_length_20827_cov_9.289801_3_plen_180_part_00
MSAGTAYLANVSIYLYIYYKVQVLLPYILVGIPSCTMIVVYAFGKPRVLFQHAKIPAGRVIGVRYPGYPGTPILKILTHPPVLVRRTILYLRQLTPRPRPGRGGASAAGSAAVGAAVRTAAAASVPLKRSPVWWRGHDWSSTARIACGCSCSLYYQHGCRCCISASGAAAGARPQWKRS